jgi:GntR family transcriptional regulator
VLLEELFFSTSVFPKLDTHAIKDRSLSTLARVHYGLSAQSLDQRFSVAHLDSKRAKLLNLPVGAAVLQVDRVVHFSAAPHAVFAVLYCKTEEAEFTQNLHK